MSCNFFIRDLIARPKAAEPLYQALTEVLREDGEFGVSDRAGYISRVYLPDDDYNNDTPQVSGSSITTMW